MKGFLHTPHGKQISGFLRTPQDESEMEPETNFESALKVRREKIAKDKLGIPPEGGTVV